MPVVCLSFGHPAGDSTILLSYTPILRENTLGLAELLPDPDEIGNLNEEVVDITRQINSEVESDDVQELLDSRNQELTMNELIEMHEQEQDIEELESVDPFQPEDRTTVDNLTGLRLIEKGFQI
ncbi:hypothetical protein TNCV_4945771 [Trichonephila clavipes]|nr:hypothetical protein TNCV_4945771 [Trichonephila clavipes]